MCDKWIRKNGLFKQCRSGQAGYQEGARKRRIVLILVTSRSKHVILFVLPAKYGYEGILGHVYQVSPVASTLLPLGEA